MSIVRQRQGKEGMLAWAVWALGASGYLVAVFHRMSLSVSGIAAQRHLHMGAFGLASLGAIELALYVVMQVPSGMGADRFGPRKMLASGLLLMGLGSSLFAVAPDLGVALVGRALIGIGDAFMFVNVLTLARSWFAGPRFAVVVALTAVAGAVGQFLATTPFAMLLGAVGWLGAYAAAAAVTVALGMAVFLVLKETPSGPRPPVHSGERPRVLQAMAQSWAQPGTRLAFWSHFVLVGTFVAFSGLWGVPYLRQVIHLSAGQAGSAVGAIVVAALILNPLVGRYISSHPDKRPVFLVGSGIASTALWVICATVAPQYFGLPVLALVVLLAGFANAAAVGSFDVVRTSNPDERAGTATGLVNMAGFMFGVAAEVGVGWMLSWLHSLGYSTFSSYSAGFGMVALLAAVGVWQMIRSVRRINQMQAPVGPAVALRRLEPDPAEFADAYSVRRSA